MKARVRRTNASKHQQKNTAGVVLELDSHTCSQESKTICFCVKLEQQH